MGVHPRRCEGPADELRSGAEITPALRAAWLAARRETVGASEAAAALGLVPRHTPLELYLEKIGELEPIIPSLPMKAGLLLEPLVAEEYEAWTGDRILRQQVYFRDGRISATLDGIAMRGRAVEFKTINERHAYQSLGEPGTDEIPERWLVQAQQQLALSGLTQVDFAVLIGTAEFRLYHATRDDALIAAIGNRIAEFWGRVERRDPPPPSTSADLRLLTQLHPRAEGEIELGHQEAEWADEWESLKLKIRALEEERDLIKARMLRQLGDAARGILPDGRCLKRKVIEVGPATIERAAYKRVDLRIALGGKR